MTSLSLIPRLAYGSATRLLNNCVTYPGSASSHRMTLLKAYPPHPIASQRSFLSLLTPFQQQPQTTETPGTMASHALYGPDTPDSVKNSKKLHLITQSTLNGQKVQIMLEELALKYGK